MREAIVAHKDRSRGSLAEPLGELLGRSIVAAVESAAGPETGPAGAGRPVIVVPVPGVTRRVLRRGYDPLRRLSSPAIRSARGRGVPVVWWPALRLVGAVDDQSELDAAARLRNVRGAFGPVRGKRGVVEGLSVVIIDDIVTTGATLVETTRALTAAGAKVIAAAVIAATSRKNK